MRKLIAVSVLFVLILTGCASFKPKTYVLTESEQKYFIPANTPFNAILVTGEPVVEVRRTVPTWAVDAGNLARLEESANACTLKGGK